MHRLFQDALLFALRPCKSNAMENMQKGCRKTWLRDRLRTTRAETVDILRSALAPQVNPHSCQYLQPCCPQKSDRHSATISHAVHACFSPRLPVGVPIAGRVWAQARSESLGCNAGHDRGDAVAYSDAALQRQADRPGRCNGCPPRCYAACVHCAVESPLHCLAERVAHAAVMQRSMCLCQLDWISCSATYDIFIVLCIFSMAMCAGTQA